MADFLNDPVTLEPLVDATILTACGHTFSRQTLDDWLPRNSSCPLCQTAVNIETGLQRNFAAQDAVDALIRGEKERKEIKEKAAADLVEANEEEEEEKDDDDDDEKFEAPAAEGSMQQCHNLDGVGKKYVQRSLEDRIRDQLKSAGKPFFDEHETCVACNVPMSRAQDQPCVHRGKWHAGLFDCRPIKCAVGLGAKNLGVQH